jgi:hypothetical protein
LNDSRASFWGGRGEVANLEAELYLPTVSFLTHPTWGVRPPPFPLPGPAPDSSTNISSMTFSLRPSKDLFSFSKRGHRVRVGRACTLAPTAKASTAHAPASGAPWGPTQKPQRGAGVPRPQPVAPPREVTGRPEPQRGRPRPAGRRRVPGQPGSAHLLCVPARCPGNR